MEIVALCGLSHADQCCESEMIWGWLGCVPYLKAFHAKSASLPQISHGWGAVRIKKAVLTV